VVLYAYDPPTELTPDNFGGHFLFGLVDAPVTRVWVDGRLRHDRGEFPGLDARALMAESRAAARAFWKRFAATPDVKSAY
jgi:hypothetical protein